MHRTIVVMGVTGSGKTTIGQLLAERIGVEYAEADSFHPPANIAKMAAGVALDDKDRHPWLTAIAAWISARLGSGGVVSCSALKYKYRDLLRAADPGLWFIHLDVDRNVVFSRLARRGDHFMPVSLVDSQFESLEALRPDEAGMVIDGSAPPESIVQVVMQHLGDDQ